MSWKSQYRLLLIICNNKKLGVDNLEWPQYDILANGEKSLLCVLKKFHMFEPHSQILVMVKTPYVIMIVITVENVTIFRESSCLMSSAHQVSLKIFPTRSRRSSVPWLYWMHYLQLFQSVSTCFPNWLCASTLSQSSLGEFLLLHILNTCVIRLFNIHPSLSSPTEYQIMVLNSISPFAN